MEGMQHGMLSYMVSTAQIRFSEGIRMNYHMQNHA